MNYRLKAGISPHALCASLSEREMGVSAGRGVGPQFWLKYWLEMGVGSNALLLGWQNKGDEETL